MYRYTSDLHGAATIMLSLSGPCRAELHRYQVEFVSGGDFSAEHGSWGIDGEGFLRINFNCREGVSRPRRCGEWQLHPTVLWREPCDAEELRNWCGGDDKGASITMTHIRSIRTTGGPGQRPVTEIIDAL